MAVDDSSGRITPGNPHETTDAIDFEGAMLGLAPMPSEQVTLIVPVWTLRIPLDVA
jgi:hypothetical protein